MMNDGKKIISGTIVYTICNIFVSGLAIITSPIFTRIMSVGDYGVYSLFNSWNNIIFCFSSIGLSYTIAPAIRKYKKIDNYTLGVTLFAVIIPLVFLFLSLFGLANSFSILFSLPKSTISLLWLELFFYTIVVLENEKMTIKGDYKKYAILATIRAIGSTSLSILMIINATNDLFLGRIKGVLLFTCFVAIYVLFSNRKSMPDKKQLFDYIKFALPIAIPMVFHGLAMIILGQIDRIMISKLYSEVETGLYSFGYSVGTIIMFVLNASSSALQPFFYENFGNDNEKVKCMMQRIIKMMFLTCLLFALVAPEVVKILADKKFWGTISIVPPIVAACFCQYVYTYYSTIEVIQNKAKYIAIGSSAAAIINAILNYLLLSKIGFSIAAYTTYIGYLFLLAFHMSVCKKVCHVNDFNYISNLGLAIVSLFLMVLVLLLYKYTLIRYVFVILITICILLKYIDVLQNIYQSLKKR